MSPAVARVSTIVANGPNVVGFSVCRSRHLQAIHTHVQGEDMAFHQLETEPSMFAVWQYMPIDAGEVLTELWKRRDLISGYQSLVVSLDALAHGCFHVTDKMSVTISWLRTRAGLSSWGFGRQVEALTDGS